MDATIKSGNTKKLRDLAVGEFGETRDRKQKHKIFVKVSLRGKGGVAEKEYFFDIVNPKDQYTDHIDTEQLVNVLQVGDIITLCL